MTQTASAIPTGLQPSLLHGAKPLGYKNDMWYPDLPAHMGRPVSLWIPKLLDDNLKYRKELWLKCENDVAWRDRVYGICRHSVLYWLNSFVWTYRPKMTCADGLERGAGSKWRDHEGVEQIVPPADTPIITWPAQDDFIDEMTALIDGTGGILLGDKSREQGATILIMAAILHGFIFRNRFSALVISRKEEMVDNGTEDSLFGKLDYMIRSLPPWMLNARHLRRTHKPITLVNRKTGARVLGESSNENVGQSLRTTLTFVDEAARYPDGEALMRSIRSVSHAKILASTPAGPGSQFSKLRRHAETTEGRKAVKVVVLGYWNHPEKGLNRVWTIDRDGAVTGKSGSGYWETPAFQAERGQSVGPRDWRENWLIDHETSGLLVLDPNGLSRLRANVRSPVRGRLVKKGKVFSQDPRGRLLLWCGLNMEGKPSVETNYVIGCDFAQGVEASNTILAVLDRTTGEQVAEYADPTIAPHEAAEVAVELGEWFGGQLGSAFIIWERNGPGMGFGHRIMQLHYPFLYYQRLETSKTAKRTRQWGWQSAGASREILFSNLDKALAAGEFISYNEQGIDDMASWIFDENGRIVCGSLRDESTGAQARHGDRAIAYGLCVMGRREAPLFVPEKVTLPSNSQGKLLGMDKVFGPRPQKRSAFSLDNKPS